MFQRPQGPVGPPHTYTHKRPAKKVLHTLRTLFPDSFLTLFLTH